MEEKLKTGKKEKLPKKPKEKNQSNEALTDAIRLDYFRKPDNKKTDFLKYILNFLVLVFLVMYGFIMAYTIETNLNKGIPTFMGTAYYQTAVPNEPSNKPVAKFDVNQAITVNSKVGVKYYDEDTLEQKIKVSKVTEVYTDAIKLEDGTTCPKTSVFGVYTGSTDADFLYSMMTNRMTFIYWCIFPIIVFIIISVSAYIILYPRKIKLNFFEEMFNGENDHLLTSSIATAPAPVATPVVETSEQDDSLAEYSAEENPIPGTNIETFYTTTKAKDGELYALVKKYQDAITDLQEYGATDMDLIRMNMVGNSEFNALLTTTHREKPMTLEEIVAYISTFDNVYFIKKRGTINWTYKYKSKTVMIVRGTNDEFKVSFKVYPDAAEKLNRVYCALEDSSFPSGPYWFMFNDLKNLSAPVAKWLIKESYIISMLQERKAELVRDESTCADLGIDLEEIRAQIDSGVNVLTYDRFAIVAHKIDKNKLELNTMLDEQIPGLFTEDYVKEVFYIVNGRDDLALSLLFAKNASEKLINALCMEIEDACTISSTQKPVQQNIIATSNDDQTPVKVVKKQVKKR